MSDPPDEHLSLKRWLAQPQSIIALSALLLSLCGLFIAVYEAALIRREQRATVWPYVEISATVTSRRIEIRARNTGVGPALVRTGAIHHDGEIRKGWPDLMRQAGVDPNRVDFYFSLVQGRVLPRDSDAEVLFRVTEEVGGEASQVIAWLQRAILDDKVDVTFCYCSVYDECWISSMQDVFRRSRRFEEVGGDRQVRSCGETKLSAI